VYEFIGFDLAAIYVIWGDGELNEEATHKKLNDISVVKQY
jgi:hypothetical protein